MGRHLEELERRYNNRNNGRIFRAVLAQNVRIKPVTYRELVA